MIPHDEPIPNRWSAARRSSDDARLPQGALRRVFTAGQLLRRSALAVSDDLARRNAIINADVLDAWFDPAPGVIGILRDHLPWLCRTSPPTLADGLRDAIAEARGLAPECVLLGAGSSDLIFRVLPRWLSHKSRVLVLDPTYGEYAHVFHNIIGCRVDRLALHREDDFALREGSLREALDRRYDLVILVNPNNPTGRLASRAMLESVLADAPRKTTIWVDEAYIDYTGPENSLERFASETGNVVVCKSMSKVYGLSGLRVAYLCGALRRIAPFRAVTPPWIVGLPAQAAAVHALRDSGYYAECYRQTHTLSLARIWRSHSVRRLGAGSRSFPARRTACSPFCRRRAQQHP